MIIFYRKLWSLFNKCLMNSAGFIHWYPQHFMHISNYTTLVFIAPDSHSYQATYSNKIIAIGMLNFINLLVRFRKIISTGRLELSSSQQGRSQGLSQGEAEMFICIF